MITFSSDTGNIRRADLEVTAKMAEDYFGTDTDLEQMPTTKEVRDWVAENIPEYLNIIRDDQTIIGYAFMLYCSLKLMNDFLAKKINEREMFEGIKKLREYKNPKVIYLCATFVKEQYRGQGLSTTAYVKMIEKIIKEGKIKPILFDWAFTPEGANIGKKIAEKTHLVLKRRD